MLGETVQCHKGVVTHCIIAQNNNGIQHEVTICETSVLHITRMAVLPRWEGTNNVLVGEQCAGSVLVTDTGGYLLCSLTVLHLC